MAKNVLPKHWNGSEFEELHIVTKASNVFTNDNKSLQQKMDDFTSHLAEFTALKEQVENMELTAENVTTSQGTTVQSEIDSLKSSVRDGKLLVRDAITNNGGTVSDADGDGVPTFQELSNAIPNIVGDYKIGDYIAMSNLGPGEKLDVGTLEYALATSYTSIERSAGIRMTGSVDGRYATLFYSNSNEPLLILDFETQTVLEILMSELGRTHVIFNHESGLPEILLTDVSTANADKIERINPLTGEILWEISNLQIRSHPVILSHLNEVWFQTQEGSDYWIYCYEWDTGALKYRHRNVHNNVNFAVNDNYYTTVSGEYKVAFYHKDTGNLYTSQTLMESTDHSPNNSRHISFNYNQIARAEISAGGTVSDGLEKTYRLTRAGTWSLIDTFVYDYFGTDTSLRGSDISFSSRPEVIIISRRENTGNTQGDYIVRHWIIPRNPLYYDNVVQYSGSQVNTTARGSGSAAGDVTLNDVLVIDYSELSSTVIHNPSSSRLIFARNTNSTNSSLSQVYDTQTKIAYNPRTFLGMSSSERLLFATHKYIATYAQTGTDASGKYVRNVKIYRFEPVHRIIS